MGAVQEQLYVVHVVLEPQYRQVLDHSPKRYRYAIKTGPDADAEAGDTHVDFWKYPSNHDKQNQKVFTTLKSLIKSNVTGTNIVLKFETMHGSTGDGRNLWIELCAYFQTSVYAQNLIKDARRRMSTGTYTGALRGNSLHQYIHLHDTYHELNLRAEPEFMISYGEAAKSEVLLEGISAPHLTIVKEHLEMNLQTLTFHEVKAQLLRADSLRSNR